MAVEEAEEAVEVEGAEEVEVVDSEEEEVVVEEPEVVVAGVEETKAMDLPRDKEQTSEETTMTQHQRPTMILENQGQELMTGWGREEA